MKVDEAYIWHLRGLVFMVPTDDVRRDAILEVHVAREEGFHSDPWRVVCSGIHKVFGTTPAEGVGSSRFDIVAKLMSEENEATITVDLRGKNVTPIKSKLSEA